MIAPADIAHCRESIRHGSRSFFAASHLLPSRVRDPSLALYAFCRQADDAVDLHDDKARAVLRLRDRLDAIYAGRPADAPEDRAFAAVVDGFDMPRALPEALLEGLAWDAAERRYATLSDLFSYSARVASAVGAMMCVLMRVRDADALARACDLGLAMQLTNIARDVGEDARARRIYLPLDWMEDAGLAPEAFFDAPAFTPGIAVMLRRLLAEADRLYIRAGAGVPALPLACRPGIYAARHIYAGIGGALRRNGHDSIAHRARTGTAAKLGWLGWSLVRTGASLVTPKPARLHARPEPEVAFLVEAATRAGARPARSAQLMGILSQLEMQDRLRLETRRAGLN